MDEYSASEDKVKASYTQQGMVANAPSGCNKIRTHFVYDVKHDGRHKARLVADGNLTKFPVDSVYSGVFSIKSLCLVIFLAELKGLDLWACDVSSGYLESYTKEKVFLITGSEFGERAGHILFIIKDLDGLRNSGKCYHEGFFETMEELGFFPSKAEHDVWMRDAGDKYEYVPIYIDDLCLALVNPQEFLDSLRKSKVTS